MASIPLAALHLQPPPQQENPLDAYGRAVGIQSLLQRQNLERQLAPSQVQQAQSQAQLTGTQAQIQQQQLVDSKLFMKALQTHNGDFDDALQDAAQNGMSGQGYLQMGMQILERKAAIAKLTGDQLGNQQKIYDTLDGELQGFKKLEPDAQAAQWPSIRQRVAQMAPQLGQMLPQQTPTGDQIDAFDAMLLGGKNLIEAQTARAKASEAKTASERLQAELPGGPLNKVTQDIQVATNPQIQAGKEKVAATEGAARANIEASMARGSNAALANVPPHLVPQATQAATRAGEDFNQARQAADDLQSMVDLAKGGNKVAYAYSPVTGVLQINIAGQTKRINTTEIEQYGGAGSALDRIKGFLGKQTTGASIPDNILNDMQAVGKSYGDNAQTKYERDLATVNQNYGSTFKPVQSAAKTQSSGMIYARDTQGKLHQAKAGTPLPSGWKEEKQP